MNLTIITKKVLQLVDEVSNFITEELKNFDTKKIEVKGINDFVSYVDKTAEKMIVKGLIKIIPESGFIAEENTSTKIGKTYNWIVDPLDGTTNFIHGVPCFCISIALKRDDTIIIGVVKEINKNESFYSYEGAPAYLNGDIINVTKTINLKDSLLATGFPYYDFEKLDEYMELFKHFMKSTHGVRRLGSAAADLAYVACGRFDAFYEYSLKPWDVAAGAFIVQQAGGKISDFKGGDNWLFGQEMVACNSKMYDEFMESIKLHFN
ncbi:MAG: inositol monophosphatase family protein [Bacteroidota bacterium]